MKVANWKVRSLGRAIGRDGARSMVSLKKTTLTHSGGMGASLQGTRRADHLQDEKKAAHGCQNQLALLPVKEVSTRKLVWFWGGGGFPTFLFRKGRRLVRGPPGCHMMSVTSHPRI
eukprot:2226239-Amphidinium_carterae.1